MKKMILALMVMTSLGMIGCASKSHHHAGKKHDCNGECSTKGECACKEGECACGHEKK